MRWSWVEVDLRAIGHNVETLAAIAAPARLCTVVKADAYGHGDVPVAVTALAHGATWLAVALVEEGIRLREAGIEAPILLLSEPPPEDAADVVRWRLTPTLYRHVFLEALATEAGETPVPVHLQLDTGMHRAGGSRDDVLSLARRVAAGGLPITIGGLWTHFAVAEEDADYTALQAGRLDAVAETLRGGGIDPGIVHLANTAGTLLSPDVRRDLVRVGLGTYGLHPSAATRDLAPLRPAMRVVSHVSLVRRLPQGARPSYGRRRPLAAESTVVTVPIGYADGVPRLLSSQGGEVLVGGRRHPLAGTVTMDQIVVDVGDAEVRVGDEVVLIGRQGDEEIGADEWAERTGTISYEIVCGMGPRLPRRYVEEDG